MMQESTSKMFSIVEIRIIKNIGSKGERGTYTTLICKEIDTTYCHTLRTMQKLLSKGILIRANHRDKRRIAYKLTKKGERIRGILINLENAMKER